MSLQTLKIFAAVTLAAVAGVTISACMQGGSKQASFETKTVPGYGLFYMDEGASAKLAYGQANSDNVGLMLQCQKGSRLIDVTDAVRATPSPTLTLVSSGVQTTLKTETQSFEGATLLVAHTRSTEAPLQAFRRSGRMQVAYAGTQYGVVATADERAGVEQFFSACENSKPA